MKTPLHTGPGVASSDSGSSLILTLLLVAILSLVAVGFLSTSKIEVQAARNFSRQNAAAGLAELATGQAMAQIQNGFTISNNGTVVITTQPGAIRQFIFANGNITSNLTTELFSGASNSNATTNGTAYLNNLRNPSSNATLTSNASNNQWTITGFANQTIAVPMEEVTITENGATRVVGRIAYYVDDEGTKLNANSAIGNRNTLNAVGRSQDIGTLVSATQASDFSGIVNNSTSNPRSITGWSHFFRPEQVAAAVPGISDSKTPLISTATSSASTTANMTHLLTPWGTQRLYINELSTNATYPIGPGNSTGDASVKSIFEAFTGQTYSTVNGTTTYGNSSSAYGLTGRGLQHIFGGNLSTKYTPTGVKQIAANILQMRDPNTSTVNASFAYTGPLLGANDLINEMPMEYLGYAPYLVISEIGISACLASHQGGPGNFTYTNSANQSITVNVPQADWGFKLQPVIELYNPYPVPFTIPAGAFPRVMIRPYRLTCNMSWSGPNGNFSGNFAFGPNSSKPATWIYSSWFGMRTSSQINRDQDVKYDLIYQANGNSTTIPPYSKIQTRLYPSGNVWDGFYTFIPLKQWSANAMGNITISNVQDIKIQLDRVILFANSGNNVGNATTGYSNTIRDWVRGVEIGLLDVEFDSSKLPYRFTWNGTDLTTDPNFDIPSDTAGQAAPIPTKSVQRISCITKIPRGNTFINIDDTNRNWTTTNSTISSTWLSNNTTWVTSNSSNFGHLGTSSSNSTDNNLATPSQSANFTTPSDPSFGDNTANAAYANFIETNEMREPFLVAGNYTSPSDLGLVPTNKRWRRLRMQMQPALEGSMIPDWAMLDVISFGNSTDTNNAFNRMLPVNINGMFHLPGNATIPPRTAGVKALAQVLSHTGTGNIQDPTNPTSPPHQLTGDETQRFKGTSATSTAITNLANAIGNMTWSTNSTWGNTTNGKRWKINNTPIENYILPSEIMEISGVADVVDQTDYNNSTSHFKWNEGRASALIPAVTTRSSFFTIYAYAQALDKQGNIDSEALAKTLVEVELATPATTPSPATYKVKKLYSQAIPLGQ
jgi:hypothetical protein